jgi:hypothetical protein
MKRQADVTLGDQGVRNESALSRVHHERVELTSTFRLAAAGFEVFASSVALVTTVYSPQSGVSRNHRMGGRMPALDAAGWTGDRKGCAHVLSIQWYSFASSQMGSASYVTPKRVLLEVNQRTNPKSPQKFGLVSAFVDNEGESKINAYVLAIRIAIASQEHTSANQIKRSPSHRSGDPPA